jgi:diguanylate cyclase
MSEHTDDYHQKLGVFSEKLENTHDIASIAEVIRDLVRETRAMKDTTEKSRSALSQAREHVKEAELRIRQMERELDQLGERVREDQLTRTLNRMGLDEAFKREAGRADRQGTAMSVALLDIDNFKHLNDSFGHKAGDQALMHIVGVIREQLRPGDALARYGGEEFVILLPDSGLPEATEVMTRLQRELTKKFFLHNNERLLITFSCGVTQRRPGEDLDAPIDRADRALYQAKRAGKNRVVSTVD